MVSFNVAQLLKSNAGATHLLDFTERLPDPADDLHLRGPVTGHVKMLRTSRGVLVESRHRAKAVFECARCVEDAPVQLDAQFAEEFVPIADVRTGQPTQAEDDAEQLLIDDLNEVRLDELLRQSFLTSQPLRPLCSPDCPGLCPECGKRLDARHTAHPEPTDQPEAASPVDPRNPFARLAELKLDVPDERAS